MEKTKKRKSVSGDGKKTDVTSGKVALDLEKTPTEQKAGKIDDIHKDTIVDKEGTTYKAIVKADKENNGDLKLDVESNVTEKFKSHDTQRQIVEKNDDSVEEQAKKSDKQENTEKEKTIDFDDKKPLEKDTRQTASSKIEKVMGEQGKAFIENNNIEEKNIKTEDEGDQFEEQRIHKDEKMSRTEVNKIRASNEANERSKIKEENY